MDGKLGFNMREDEGRHTFSPRCLYLGPPQSGPVSDFSEFCPRRAPQEVRRGRTVGQLPVPSLSQFLLDQQRLLSDEMRNHTTPQALQK